MKMRKNICLLAAAVMLAAGMTSCGDNGSGENDQPASEPAQTAAPAEPAQAQPASAAAADVADRLRNEITYVDSLNTISDAMVQKLYGIAPEKYTSGRIYIGGVSTAEEIACFDAADDAAAEEIMTACNNRIAAQIKALESYKPDELPKLRDPVLVKKGKSVFMCISNDNDKAKSIIG